MTAPIELGLTRLIAAPRALVWKAWTTPEIIETWFCPKPWRAEIVKFDLRPGGAFETVMHGPEGERFGEPGAFLDVAEGTRLVFTSCLAEGWRPTTPGLAMTAIITMADEGTGTRYDARVLHATEEDRQKHEEMGFHPGWNAATDQLAEAAAALA